jgi:segregation and condensation protein B
MLLKDKIESILFVSSKPLSLKQLIKFLDTNEAEVRQALDELAASRKDSGIVILEASGHVQLATHSENTELVKNFLNSDLREKLTDATIEVLSIIAYRQPISKSEIEAIRGVNSQYSVRQLLMRGLIEKVNNPNDARGSLYQVTTEFLQQLGIQSIADLPDFQKLTEHIKLPEVALTKNEGELTQEPTASEDYSDPVHGTEVPPSAEDENTRADDEPEPNEEIDITITHTETPQASEESTQIKEDAPEVEDDEEEDEDEFDDDDEEDDEEPEDEQSTPEPPTRHPSSPIINTYTK